MGFRRGPRRFPGGAQRGSGGESGRTRIRFRGGERVLRFRLPLPRRQVWLPVGQPGTARSGTRCCGLLRSRRRQRGPAWRAGRQRRTHWLRWTSRSLVHPRLGGDRWGCAVHRGGTVGRRHRRGTADRAGRVDACFRACGRWGCFGAGWHRRGSRGRHLWCRLGRLRLRPGSRAREGTGDWHLPGWMAVGLRWRWLLVFEQAARTVRAAGRLLVRMTLGGHARLPVSDNCSRYRAGADRGIPGRSVWGRTCIGPSGSSRTGRA